ncbi:TrmB family transcriptional regulator [Sphingomonas sp. NPDC079357]|jgi:sugar-specific transcriptional regulator TrmB|uniref:TrmB family transcriptional regulator n=1 Tax=Sphingomonas sp. NPDC079357 TaxID=3364518 RepID=UPI00385095E2
MNEPESALTALGFNQLESNVYCELLRQSPATGYRLAQRLGRAPANVYQALNALTQKGAILDESDSGEAATYVPVPPAQLLASLRHGFDERIQTALTTLQSVHAPPPEETLSRLRTVPQTIERARAMLASVQQTVMLDMMPPLYDLFKADLVAAQKRGVQIAGIAYRREDVSATMPYKGQPPAEVVARWPGLGMILVTDASEMLLAQVRLEPAHVLNAVYTDSRFLSCVIHGLLQTDIRLVALRAEGPEAVPPSPLDALELRRAQPPGLAALLAR